jgi:hypothetical protein
MLADRPLAHRHHDSHRQRTRRAYIDTTHESSYPEDIERPTSRGECRSAQRPCPWVTCRHHLGLDVTDTGTVQLDSRFLRGELRETCALDVADRGGVTLEAIGTLLGLTRERIRQIETEALAKLAAAQRG